MTRRTTDAGTVWRNWSGQVVAHPAQTLAPSHTQDVADAVVAARANHLPLRMVGTGHSFTDVAATDGLMLRPDRLVGIRSVDRTEMTVTALAGTPLHVLNAHLERLGLALHNLGDIDRQTVAGAISTGTHGTGGRWASLSAQVAALELVTADGTVRCVSPEQDRDLFQAARLGLGAVGVITAVTFLVEPAFTLEAVEQPLAWADALSRFDELVETHHHVDMYWFPHTDRVLAKCNDRTLDEPRPLSRVRARLDDELLANTVFGWLNRAGNRVPAAVPRINRMASRALSARTYSDVSHRVFTSPREVAFREMEYAVPREAGVEALVEVRRLVERAGWRIGFPVEVRTAPADDVWLSTAHGRDSVYLAIHVNARTEHEPYFSEVERLLRGYDGRPHWGKLHTRTAEDLAPAYPAWDRFRVVRDRVDPDRLFANPYLARVLGA
jgi:L-gulonolactone oxidase